MTILIDDRKWRHTEGHLCGLYYKPKMIRNDDSRVVNKLETSLTDDARVIIYDCHEFIVQANGRNRRQGH